MLYGSLIIKLRYFFKNYFPIILRKLPHVEQWEKKNTQEYKYQKFAFKSVH